MKKLIYLTIDKIQDKRSWSGTTYRMYKALSKEYDIIEMTFGRTLIEKGFDLIIRIITLNKYKRYPVLDIFKKIRLRKAIKKYPGITIFAPIASDITPMLKGLNCKIIYLSDTNYKDFGSFYINNPITKKRDHIEQEALDIAQQIIFSSSWPIQTCISHYKISNSKINVVKFGSNLKDEYREKQTPTKIVKLLIVGVDYYRKGFDLAIETVQSLNKQHSDKKFMLHIIGFSKPDNFSDGNIIFHGRLNKNNPDEENIICSIYKECDIFILPTIADCSPIVLCEASMFGLPSISFDVGGVKDYLQNNYNGVLLEKTRDIRKLDDAVMQILDSYTIYSNNARKKYIDELNWDTWLQNFDQIFDKLN